jgi:hypothetical protein
MHVQATSRPSTTGTTLHNRVCLRCSTRLSRNNLDDVCQACSRPVTTVDAPVLAESRQPKITGATTNVPRQITPADRVAINQRLAWVEAELAMLDQRLSRVEANRAALKAA